MSKEHEVVSLRRSSATRSWAPRRAIARIEKQGDGRGLLTLVPRGISGERGLGARRRFLVARPCGDARRQARRPVAGRQTPSPKHALIPSPSIAHKPTRPLTPDHPINTSNKMAALSSAAPSLKVAARARPALAAPVRARRSTVVVRARYGSVPTQDSPTAPHGTRSHGIRWIPAGKKEEKKQRDGRRGRTGNLLPPALSLSPPAPFALPAPSRRDRSSPTCAEWSRKRADLLARAAPGASARAART